jgi:hypothetical protein
MQNKEKITPILTAVGIHKYGISAEQSCLVTGLEWPRGFQEVKVPRFHDNGTG